MARASETHELLITDCSHPMYWYRNSIGKRAPLLAVFSDCYKSRETQGPINFVQLQDAQIVEIAKENQNDHNHA